MPKVAKNKSLKVFSNKMRKLDEKIKKASHERLVKAAGDVHKALVLGTPVDSSKALSNWKISFNKPNTNENEEFFSGTGGSTRHLSAPVRIGIGKRKLQLKKIDDVIFINNNVDYIKYLNDNHEDVRKLGGFMFYAYKIFFASLRKHKLKI